MKTQSRIEKLFRHEKAFIGYLTACDGGMQRTLDAALALIKGGVNLLEIGMPFSDPVADGPVIQRAAERSLAAGTTLQDVLLLAKKIRKHSDIPLVLFSYINPILSAVRFNFFQDAKNAGIDGIILVDCPLEESILIHHQCRQNNIALINVVAPSTSLSRIKKIDSVSEGFLYYACRKGVTGVKNLLPDDFDKKIQAIKSAVHLPVVVGFGISDRKMCSNVLKYADGVVIGSLFVKALEDGIIPSDLSTIARQLLSTELYCNAS